LKINNQVKIAMMNNKKTQKSKPRGRPQVSTLKRLTKSVTVKFSKPDYEKLRHRSKNANCTLAEYIRDAAFDARIVAKHSAEDAAIIRNLTGMANNLNQLTKLSHQTGFYRTKNIVMELLAKLKEVLSDYKAEERRCR
jgi:vacuolar-type H+-ATPase catalytic subunit A/Vma1